MYIDPIFELSIVMNTAHFKKVFRKVISSGKLCQSYDDEYIDPSMMSKGITVIYRDSQYKKKIRLLVNVLSIVEDITDTEKLIRKLNHRICEYFEAKYELDDFVISGVNFVMDINVRERENVSAYLKVLKRIRKVKGFSSSSYYGLESSASFCLSGNSNGIDFLLYDLESTMINQLAMGCIDERELMLARQRMRCILRTEVRLTKPKAIRAYSEEVNIADQIAELIRLRENIFMETFSRVVPFGDFYKKGRATEIICREVKDTTMRKKMLRLLALVPEKKSLHLAQKATNYRDMEQIMAAFTKIHISPVTLSKRHEGKHLKNLYSYFI